MAQVPDADDTTLMPASLLAGTKVAGADGAALGTIADIMLETAAGRIVYVAVSVGGVLGLGERLFAVPWSAFVVDPVEGDLRLRFAAAALDDRPGFDKDRWPTLADESLAQLGPATGV